MPHSFSKTPKRRYGQSRLDFIEWDHFAHQFVHELVQEADRAFTQACAQDHAGFQERHRREDSVHFRFQCVQQPFLGWFAERNRNQRRCVDYHQPGIPKASYPRISSGVRASTTGRAPILAQRASTFFRLIGRSVFWSLSSRATITASLRVTPIRLLTCSAKRWASGFLIYSVRRFLATAFRVPMIFDCKPIPRYIPESRPMRMIFVAPGGTSSPALSHAIMLP